MFAEPGDIEGLQALQQQIEDYIKEQAEKQGLEGDGAGKFRLTPKALRLFQSKKPLISACNGAAVGVGVTMQLPMDIRLASDNARYGFVFARRGIVPEACSSWFLPKIVGVNQALEWCMTGRIFGAEEAHKAGLVRSVHAPGELIDAARGIAVDGETAVIAGAAGLTGPDPRTIGGFQARNKNIDTAEDRRWRENLGAERGRTDRAGRTRRHFETTRDVHVATHGLIHDVLPFVAADAARLRGPQPRQGHVKLPDENVGRRRRNSVVGEWKRAEGGRATLESPRDIYSRGVGRTACRRVSNAATDVVVGTDGVRALAGYALSAIERSPRFRQVGAGMAGRDQMRRYLRTV